MASDQAATLPVSGGTIGAYSAEGFTVALRGPNGEEILTGEFPVKLPVHVTSSSTSPDGKSVDVGISVVDGAIPRSVLHAVKAWANRCLADIEVSKGAS